MMPRGDPDPRLDPAPLAQVPALLAEGAADYNAGRFWHAHESWEKAWHALRAEGQLAEADYVQAMVWVTAAFENFKRGKPEGARRQLAKASVVLRRLQGLGEGLGLADEAGFVAAVARAAEGEGPAPRLDLRPVP